MLPRRRVKSRIRATVFKNHDGGRFYELAASDRTGDPFGILCCGGRALGESRIYARIVDCTDGAGAVAFHVHQDLCDAFVPSEDRLVRDRQRFLALFTVFSGWNDESIVSSNSYSYLSYLCYLSVFTEFYLSAPSLRDSGIMFACNLVVYTVIYGVGAGINHEFATAFDITSRYLWR